MAINQSIVNPVTILYCYVNAKVDPTYENILLPAWKFPNVATPTYEFGDYGADKVYKFNNVGGTGYLQHIDKNSGKIKINLLNENVRYTPKDLLSFNSINYIAFRNTAFSNTPMVTNDPVDNIMACMTQPKAGIQGTNSTHIFGFYDENRWYFAFVKKVTYINDQTLELEFEIDLIQSYWRTPKFDSSGYHTGTEYENTTSIRPCFVEREHTNNDAIGANIIEENLELGDYTVTASPIYDMNEQCIGMLATQVKNGDVYEPAEGQTFENIYTPLHFSFSITGNTSADGRALTQEYVDDGKEDAIVALYQFPKKFMSSDIVYDNVNIEMPSTIDGYTPKNNKLFTYPYSLIVVSNNSGETAEFKWEQWQANKQGQFTVAGTSIVSPSAFLYPVFYRGKGIDFDSGLPFTNFPMLPFAGDAFKAYWAQNKTGVGTRIASSIGGLLASAGVIASGAVTGGASIALGAGAIASSVSTVGNALSKIKDTQNIPPQAHGEMPSTYLATGMRRLEYTFNVTCIRSQFARVIDDYFTAFGYATNRIKIPNIGTRSRRKNYCYIKTQGCQLDAKYMPTEVKKQIEAIFDKGVRVWKDISTYLDLSVDNSIV